MLRFDKKMTVHTEEPDWNILSDFGLPISTNQTVNSDCSYNMVIKNIILASNFLIENKNDVNYNRLYDAFKALLLALKIHFPSKFLEIEKNAGMELTAIFDLDNISGRDIKLRNICLSNIAEYYKKISRQEL